MKVLFLNPPFYKYYSRAQRSPAVTKGGTCYYPFWLCYAAGVLLQHKIDCEVIDAIAKDLSVNDIVSIIGNKGFGMIVCDTSTPSINSDLNVANEIKKAFPDIVVVFVGTHASALPEDTLKSSDSVDIIARGEYDYTILDLVKNIDNLAEVNGITYRNESGDIIANPSREMITNIDELPSLAAVYKKFLDTKNYYFAAADYPMIMLVTGRGCPGRCFFCLYPQTMFGRKYRYMSTEKVVDEMKYIIKEFPEVREVVFEDDTFTANIQRIRDICSLLIKDHVRIKWTCNVRVSLDLETMKLMKRAGCRLLVAGYESGNQTLLNTMHKWITLEQSFAFAKNAKKAKLLVHGCFMFGFPGETKETMEQTFQFARVLNSDSAQFYPLFVYPGTEAYDWATTKNAMVESNFQRWINEDGSHRSIVNLGGDLTPEYITLFCENAYRRYHLRPVYVFKKIIQLFTQPREGIRSLHSGFNYFFNTGASK